MSFTFDTSNNIGKVRAITGDIVEASAVLTDEQITVFLNLCSSDILTSAAMALRAIAASKALLEKYKSAGNYTEDTRGVARVLLDAADKLEVSAKAIPADAQVEQIIDDFSYNNIIRNKILRGEPLDN